MILISEFVILEIRMNYTKMFEAIPISEFMNPEMRITSPFRLFRQAGRLTGFHFAKPLLSFSGFSQPLENLENESNFSSHGNIMEI